MYVEKPRYLHTCKGDVFLGECDQRGVSCDLYYNGVSNLCKAKLGDDPSDVVEMGMECASSSTVYCLRECSKRAKSLIHGILCGNINRESGLCVLNNHGPCLQIIGEAEKCCGRSVPLPEGVDLIIDDDTVEDDGEEPPLTDNNEEVKPQAITN